MTNKRGRPRKYVESIDGTIKEPTYEDSHAVRLLDLLSRGFLNVQCMAALGINHDTFYSWIKEYEDFGTAYKIGRPRSESYWAAKLQEMVERGDDKGCKACIMILNNHFGWGQNEIANKANINKFTQITVQGSVNLIDQKTSKELIESVQQDLDFLKQRGIVDASFKLLDNDNKPNE